MIKMRRLKGIKFALVFPCYRNSNDIVFLKTMKKDLGKIPPLSLLSVAAILIDIGCKVKLIDANAEDISLEKTILILKEFKPDFIGFTLSTYQFHFTINWIKKIRESIDVPIITGGPHARLYPREILSHSEIDYVIIGDAEKALPKLMHTITEAKNIDSLKKIGGIAFKNNNKILVNYNDIFLNDIESVPFPARNLIDNSLYYSLISEHKNFTAMTTTRGCIFNCTFCDNNQHPYRTMSAKRTVDEIEQCNKEFGIQEFDMFDGLFASTNMRLEAIANEIIKRHIKIYWSFRSHITTTNKNLLRLLKQSGCIRIYYGLESGSSIILKNLKKRISKEYVRKQIIETKNAGISAFGYFMVGSPGETKETIKKTKEFMLSLPLDYVQISPIFYPPGTELYKEVINKLGYDYWKEYTIKPNFKIVMPTIGTKLKREEIDKEVMKLYFSFYLRFKFLLSLFRKITSPMLLFRGIRAIFDMIKEFLT